MKDFHEQGTSLEDSCEEIKSWEDLVEWERQCGRILVTVKFQIF